MRLGLVITAALVLSSARALAQHDAPKAELAQPYQGRREADMGSISLRAGGILVMPLGETSERFVPGGGFDLGLTLGANTPVGLRLDYTYSHYGLRDDLLARLALDGHHDLHGLSLNLLFRPTIGAAFGLYFVGGPGIYHRSVTISHAQGDGERSYCDAFLFFCFPSQVSASQVIGSQSSSDFGLNAGMGLYLMLAPPLRMYVEARYHYVWGPSFQTFTGETVDSDAAYLPAVVGIAY
jgi:hypothetical protein